MEKSELYYQDIELIKKRIGNRKILHGHTPDTEVYDTGRFISCDLGASVIPNAKLALVDLKNQTYYAYRFKNDNIEHYPIAK